MLLSLILSWIFAGSSACNNENCTNVNLTRQLYETQYMPNRSQLAILCPMYIEALECEKTELECHGQSLDELATSIDRRTAKLATALSGKLSVITEICEDNSTLQQNYLEISECTRDEFRNVGGKCLTIASKPIDAFFHQHYSKEEVYSKHAEQVICFKDAFHTACMVDQLGVVCGNVAKTFAEYSLGKMKDALRVNRCDGMEITDDLVTRVMDFLELEEPRKSTFQGIVNLFRT